MSINIVSEIEEYGLPIERVEEWSMRRFGVSLNGLTEQEKGVVCSMFPRFVETLMAEIASKAEGTPCP